MRETEAGLGSLKPGKVQMLGGWGAGAGGTGLGSAMISQCRTWILTPTKNQTCKSRNLEKDV